MTTLASVWADIAPLVYRNLDRLSKLWFAETCKLHYRIHLKLCNELDLIEWHNDFAKYTAVKTLNLTKAPGPNKQLSACSWIQRIGIPDIPRHYVQMNGTNADWFSSKDSYQYRPYSWSGGTLRELPDDKMSLITEVYYWENDQLPDSVLVPRLTHVTKLCLSEFGCAHPSQYTSFTKIQELRALPFDLPLMEWLATLKHLTSLTFAGPYRWGDLLPCFTALTNLVHLSVRGWHEMFDEHLPKLTRLRSLEVYSSATPVVFQLTSLTSLCVFNRDTSIPAPTKPSLPNLISLFIDDTETLRYLHDRVSPKRVIIQPSFPEILHKVSTGKFTCVDAIRSIGYQGRVVVRYNGQ